MNDLSVSSPKTKFIMWITIFIFIGGTFYWFLIKPQFAQIKELDKQIAVKQQKLAVLQLAHQREKVLLAENKLLQDRINELQNILPPQRNEFLFGEEFQTLAKLCGIEIVNLNFGTKQAKGAPSDTVQFTISVNADKLEKINWFFTHIATFPQIVSLNKVSISKGAGAAGRYTGASSKTSLYTVGANGMIYLSAKK